MLNRRMKKILASLIIAVFAIGQVMPIGLCAPIAASARKTSKKPVSTKPALRNNAAPKSLKLQGDIAISRKNPKITLSLRDSDVKQVLRMFADKAGMNIIFHSSVGTESASSSSSNSGSTGSSSTVTMDLVNVPLNDAFKMVLEVSGLTYFLENNTIVVSTSDAAKTLNMAKQELLTLPVKYVDATAMASFLNKNIFASSRPGLSNSEVAVTDTGSNSVIIFGTKNDYLMAKKIVDQFDKKPLEETFVVNHTTPREMAYLICNVLYRNLKDVSDSDIVDDSGSDDDSDDNIDLSEDDDSSSDSSDSDSVSKVALGMGLTACKYNNKIKNDSDLTSLNSSGLVVTYFTQRGTITISGGSPQQLQMAKDFVLKNDKKQPQAILEVSILELTETGSKDFNNTWNVYSEFFSFNFASGKLSTSDSYPMIFGQDYPVYNTATPATVNPQTLLYNLAKWSGGPSVKYSMSYSVSNSKGRVLANPKIIITNGQTSKIDLSSDYVKTVTSQVITSNGVQGSSQSTYEIGNDEGIKVEMNPFISPEGYVTLNIKPEYVTQKGEPIVEENPQTHKNDIKATLMQRRNLSLKNIRIKDGETLVIGGMIKENETKTVSKFPILGDVPGIGMFFRNSSTKLEKGELVIMLTPRIIKDDEDMQEARKYKGNVTL